MQVLVNILIVLAAFSFMEFAAWATHKYIMHGPLWVLHKDHHVVEKGFFERNDAFFLIFAVPSFLCILFGAMNEFDFRFWIGLGIAIYGFTYFLVHDVFIHQRFKWLRNSQSAYFRAIRKAHKVHHKYLTKEHGECFGMLVVPRKFLSASKEYIKKREKTSVSQS